MCKLGRSSGVGVDNGGVEEKIEDPGPRIESTSNLLILLNNLQTSSPPPPLSKSEI